MSSFEEIEVLAKFTIALSNALAPHHQTIVKAAFESCSIVFSLAVKLLKRFAAVLLVLENFHLKAYSVYDRSASRTALSHEVSFKVH